MAEQTSRPKLQPSGEFPVLFSLMYLKLGAEEAGKQEEPTKFTLWLKDKKVMY